MASDRAVRAEELGFCVGIGLTVEAAAETVGVSVSTYYNDTAAYPAEFERGRSLGTLCAAKRISAEVAKLKTGVKAEEKIISRLDDALKITDKVIKHLTDENSDRICMECGRLPADAVKELIAGHKAITQWASRFAASEAPKRVQVEGEVQHAHKFIPPALVQRLARFSVKNAKYLPPADAVEAEVIEN